jgi:enoyl-CoA hydratase/carnithine racemase
MPIRTERRAGVAVVTIDLPEKRNALAPPDAVELAAAISAAGADDVAAVVLTGKGAFCAGGDLKAFAEISATRSAGEIEAHVYRDVQSVLRALRDSPVPTIAAVDGPAVGLGLDLALGCDMRFVGPKGVLVQGWARAGLIAGTGGVALLQRLNPGVLWRLLATQERLDAAAAERMGLAEVGDPSALDAALHRADQLTALPRPVGRAYAELSRSDRWPDDAHFAACARYQAGFIASEEFRNATRSMLGL